MQILLNMIRGYAMGAADVVPGVSGGTVALVLGIYERLVHSVRLGSGALGRLLRGDVRGAVDELRKVDWVLLLSLLAGIVAAIVTLARLIESLLEDQPVAMAAMFFGLVAASLVVAWRLIRQPSTQSLWIAAASAAAVFFLVGIRAGRVADPAPWMFFAVAAVAICAMILPGVSGSFLLLMLGMYEAVLGIVNDRDVASIALFVLGAIVGLALFSTALDRALRSHHDRVMAILVGLMAGSLRVLWPWPDGTESAVLGSPGGSWWWPVMVAIVAFGVVFGIAMAVAQPHDAKTFQPTD